MASSIGIPLQIPQPTDSGNAGGLLRGLGTGGRRVNVPASIRPPQVQAVETRQPAGRVELERRVEAILLRIFIWQMLITLQSQQDPQVLQMQLIGPWREFLPKIQIGWRQDESATCSTSQPSS